jgi:23S rRNA pseudouridine1911/1915/1917 synthase
VYLTVSGAPIRLDRFLLRHPIASGLGRRRLAALLAAGTVRVNGRAARKGTTVSTGDAITLAWPCEPTSGITTAIPLAVLYENADLVAVDKPPGVPTTIGPTAGPSIAAGLLARFPEMAVIDAARAAGLVHRLDTGTSGLLIAARNPAAYGRLRQEFRRKRIVKDYLAVVRGRLDHAQVMTQPLARHPRRRSRMIVARRGVRGWTAETEIAPMISDGELSVVRLRMRTGVTHQLRLHLSLLGHPVLGDRRYGDPTRESGLEVAWHYLHARALSFDASDLPRDLGTPFPNHWRALFATRRWSIEATATR